MKTQQDMFVLGAYCTRLLFLPIKSNTIERWVLKEYFFSLSVLFCYQQEKFIRSPSIRQVVNLLMIWSARVLSSPPSLLDNPADTAWKWSCATLTASLSAWLFSSNLMRRSLNFLSSFSLLWSWDWSFRKIKNRKSMTAHGYCCYYSEHCVSVTFTSIAWPLLLQYD